MLAPTTTALALIVTLLAYLASRTFLGGISPSSKALLHTMVNAAKAPAYFISHGGPPSKIWHPDYANMLGRDGN